MSNRGVKVEVDYHTGYYYIYGIYQGDPIRIQKPIRGTDRDGEFKASFSRRLIGYRREEMENEMERILKEEPNFKYSPKLLKKVDPLMYKILEDWDRISLTTYSRDYLKTMTCDYSKSKEQCRKIRAKKLRRAGISMSYETGLFKTSKGLKFMDRVRGSIFARNQKQMCNAKVDSSFILKDDYEEDSDLEIELVDLNENSPKKEHKASKEQFKQALRSNGVAVKEEKKSLKHFGRKLADKADSIKNKKYHFGEKGKRGLIKGVATILAVGALFAGVKTLDSKQAEFKERQASSVVTIIDDEPEESEVETDKNNELVDFVEKEATSETSQESTSETETASKTGTEPETEIETTTDSSSKVDLSAFSSNEAKADKEESSSKVDLSAFNSNEAKVDKEENNASKDSEKTEAEKLAELRDFATEKFKSAIVVGETPNVGDILIDQTFAERPDGTGRTGHFKSNTNYTVSQVDILTEKGYEIVDVAGKDLSSILAEHPDCITYSIHFKNAETGGGLGFVTQSQYEQLIQNKVNEVIKSKTNSNKTIAEDDFLR